MAAMEVGTPLTTVAENDSAMCQNPSMTLVGRNA